MPGLAIGPSEWYPLLSIYCSKTTFLLAETTTPMKSNRTSPKLAKLDVPADNPIPNTVLKYYKTPLCIEVDIDKVVIDKQKRFPKSTN